MAVGEEVEVRAVDMWLKDELDLGETGESIITTWGPSDTRSMKLTDGDEDDVGDPDEDCPNRRRRLQWASPPTSEAAFYEQWQGRLECWWVATPYRNGLGACFGALGLHLAHRLERALQVLHPGFRAPPEAFQGARAEHACEWLEQSELQLPQFPSLGRFEFTLPPIPRLLPSLKHLQALERPRVHAANARLQETDSSSASSISAPVTTAMGALAGLATASAVLFALSRLRQMGRFTLRANAKGGGSQVMIDASW